MGERYRLDDQRDKLGEPPWSGEPVVAWESAHGHDCRLPCYPEHGCLILAQELEDEQAEVERLRAERDRLTQGIRHIIEFPRNWNATVLSVRDYCIELLKEG